MVGRTGFPATVFGGRANVSVARNLVPDLIKTWAVQDSNLWLPSCEDGTLPLS
jgi:hypothetical protein